MSNDFYIYIHLRADSGIPFYIGKGRKGRAYNMNSRNLYWKNVKAKYGIIIELLHEGLNREQANLLEIQEIAWCRKTYPGKLTNITDGGGGVILSEQTGEKKNKIRQFYEKNRRLPNQLIHEEKKLWNWLFHYCSPSQEEYDAEFHAEFRILGYGHRMRKSKLDTHNGIREFMRIHGRFPSECRIDEKQLYKRLTNYCSPSSKSYDEAFSTEMRNLGYGKNRRGVNLRKVT